MQPALWSRTFLLICIWYNTVEQNACGYLQFALCVKWVHLSLIRWQVENNMLGEVQSCVDRTITINWSTSGFMQLFCILSIHSVIPWNITMIVELDSLNACRIRIQPNMSRNTQGRPVTVVVGQRLPHANSLLSTTAWPVKSILTNATYFRWNTTTSSASRSLTSSLRPFSTTSGCLRTSSQPMCAKKKPRMALWGSASVSEYLWWTLWSRAHSKISFCESEQRQRLHTPQTKCGTYTVTKTIIIKVSVSVIGTIPEMPWN